MVKRRKMLIGLGSAAAGSAAAVGTGAFSQGTLNDRPVNVDVVPDDQGFLALSADESEHANGTYAEVNDGGKLEINLTEDANIDQQFGFGIKGEGLNPDALYYFDDLFGVYNASEREGLDYGIDWSGLDHPNNFEFYWCPPQFDPSQDRPDIDRNGDNGNWVRDAGIGGTPSGSFESFGMAVKTPDTLEEGWESGTVDLFGNFD